MNANDYVAHFQAHSGIPISHLKFSHGGQLLLTSSVTGTVFNVFLLHLHPTVSSLSSIQHIYTLNRGNTAAKVNIFVLFPKKFCLKIRQKLNQTRDFLIHIKISIFRLI